MDCSLSGSCVHGILQARILEWVVEPSSMGSSRPREQTLISYVYLHWQVGFLPLASPGKPGIAVVILKITSLHGRSKVALNKVPSLRGLALSGSKIKHIFLRNVPGVNPNQCNSNPKSSKRAESMNSLTFKYCVFFQLGTKGCWLIRGLQTGRKAETCPWDERTSTGEAGCLSGIPRNTVLIAKNISQNGEWG